MESQINYKQGVRAGVETHWYENGQKRWEMIYMSGRMVSKKQWDVDGNEQK
jgi:antitoxin component YwqK of YwqJK toxin-antitoxin module